MNFTELIAACEADVRAGQTQNVGKRLAKLNTARVPREFRLPLANLCRRAGLHSLGVTLLTRIVHPLKDNPFESASSHELAEYAVLLLRSGALSEALETLNRVSVEKVPETALYRAFCHFTGWEFQQAIPHLRGYLRTSASAYQTLVGQVNLSYALVESDRLEEASELLARTIAETKANGHSRLEANSHSLRAQMHLKNQDFAGALDSLEDARRLLPAARTEDFQFITKWKLIVQALQNRSLEPLQKLRALARLAQDWEGVREADLFSLKLDFQRGRFLHLVFGTPFPEYRSRIARETGEQNDRTVYVFGEKRAPRLDLRTAEIDGNPALNPGRKSHQLIEVLLRDFYRPQRVPAIFSNLFPGEHFDIFSSPDRVHQAIRRTRRWMEGEAIPLSIEEKNGFYTLNITGDFSFRVPLERQPVECMHLHFNNLLTAFGQIPGFSAKDAKEKLGLSRRTIQRLMTWGIENGKITRFGTSKTDVKYRLIQEAGESPQKSAA